MWRFSLHTVQPRRASDAAAMRDILIDGLPIVDLLEINPSTNEVAQWNRCDQSSVSRIYRHVSSCLDLGFRKSGGIYRAHRNQEVLQALRQAAQLLRLSRGIEHLQWLGHPWNGQALAQLAGSRPLPRSWFGERRTLELLQRRVIDVAVVRGLDLLPPGWEDSRFPFRFGDWAAVGLVQQPLELATRLGDALQSRAGLQLADLEGTRVLSARPDPFPVQSRCLERLGLEARAVSLHSYSPAAWEGQLQEGEVLATTPISRQAVAAEQPLEPLPLTSGMAEVDVVLVHQELLEQPAVQELITAIRHAYRQAYANLEGLTWL